LVCLKKKKEEEEKKRKQIKTVLASCSVRVKQMSLRETLGTIWHL
jgi:hypothetical protein